MQFSKMMLSPGREIAYQERNETDMILVKNRYRVEETT
jgi:hypothetical protein